MRLTNFQAFKLQVSEFQKFCLIVSRFQQRNNQSNCQRIQGKRKNIHLRMRQKLHSCTRGWAKSFFRKQFSRQKKLPSDSRRRNGTNLGGGILRWHYHITLRYPDLYRHRQCKRISRLADYKRSLPTGFHLEIEAPCFALVTACEEMYGHTPTFCMYNVLLANDLRHKFGRRGFAEEAGVGKTSPSIRNKNSRLTAKAKTLCFPCRTNGMDSVTCNRTYSQ